MTTYYVGPGGNNSNNGTTWTLRKLTITGVEALTLAGDDVVYVGPGTYREQVTCAHSGTSGHPITFIGDYLGANTDGIGGIVRVTGSNNDTTATRASCFVLNGKSFRTFRGFLCDMTSGNCFDMPTTQGNIIELCVLEHVSTGLYWDVSGSGANTIRKSIVRNYISNALSNFNGSLQTGNVGHLAENCILGPCGNFTPCVRNTKGGGVTVRNCVIQGVYQAILSDTTGAAVVTANNTIFTACIEAVHGQVSGDIVEDYNSFWGNGTDRTNVATGTHSLAYPPLFDARVFFQMMFAGAGPYSPLQLVSPVDLASYSQLINVAGTSSPATDLRGSSAIGGTRDWGPLEYDSTLKSFGDIHKNRIWSR